MNRSHGTDILFLAILLAGSLAMAQDASARTSERWIYLQTNLLPDKNVEEALALIARTAKEGYNGVLLTDSKFMGWDKQPPSYIANVTKVREACRDHTMKVIAGVMPIGYYLVKGEGPWSGSWEGLPRDVVVMNWHLNPKGSVESLKHFADRGNRQILAGYYDADPSRIRDWLNDAGKVEGVIGVMYTTWEHNFTQTQAFLDAAQYQW